MHRSRANLFTLSRLLLTSLAFETGAAAAVVRALRMRIHTHHSAAEAPRCCQVHAVPHFARTAA